ncbi:hypothetical protein OH76DRAFT_166407 [Lentinus brumalis]|uniref:DUF7587 domain-containing protein n=1 Tax=Lentinus brumalis TaxID=2498619 RepID=A0A371DJ28_9APHY|nr:hypothetical protein OH76DRAFT_166407 [Polyporus brumalis]
MVAGDSQVPSTPAEGSAQERNALPQYGFGADVAFDQLVESNPFLFRIHTPKEPSPFYDKTEPYFVGQAFADNVSSSAFRASSVSPYRAPSTYTYQDVSQHMDWTTRATSPFVSTSFSFAWAIWEATRRYHHGLKHSVEIAIIDAKALSGRAVTAVELLRQGAPKDRHADHWKWYRYALEAQDVLIWGYVPGSAVLASIPLAQILSKLPSYFLNPDPSNLKDTPISRVGWDYERKKYSYRVFCQEMSERFLRMPVDRRMRDTSAGAVRLAIALLRPWFHRMATDDFTTATASACELALSIARWPGLWWVREHPEINDLIRCLVHIVGEEAREARRTQALADATRMQDIVGGLEHLTRTLHTRGDLRSSFSFTSTSSTASCADEDEDETRVDRELVFKRPELPTEPKTVRVFTPPTPMPTPPPRSLSEIHEDQDSATEKAKADETVVTAEVKEQAATARPEATSSDTPPKSPVISAARRLLRPNLAEGESSLDYYTRTASALLTGFFLGTFITLCVLSPHRREIANHFT